MEQFEVLYRLDGSLYTEAVSAPSRLTAILKMGGIIAIRHDLDRRTLDKLVAQGNLRFVTADRVLTD